MLDAGKDQTREIYPPLSSTGGTNSCMTGPSGKYILIGTLRTLYAPSFSCSVDGDGRPCIDAEEGGTCAAGGGGEVGRLGVVVGVILEATRQ